MPHLSAYNFSLFFVCNYYIWPSCHNFSLLCVPLDPITLLNLHVHILCVCVCVCIYIIFIIIIIIIIIIHFAYFTAVELVLKTARVSLNKHSSSFCEKLSNYTACVKYYYYYYHHYHHHQ